MDADRTTLPPTERLFPLVHRHVGHNKGRKPLISADDPRITSTVSAEQWQKLLGLIATGVKQTQAVELLAIEPAALEGMLRGDPVKHRAWREALIASDRRGWSGEMIEDICALIANKTSVKHACLAHGKEVLSFLMMVRRDPTVKEMYEEARIIAAEMEGDELREIADDDTADLADDGKGGYRPNTAAVNRSKLRVETRLRLMSSYNRQRFGEDKQQTAANVTVNINHADRLESARGRAKKAGVAEIIEGTAVELLPPPGSHSGNTGADDTSWMD